MHSDATAEWAKSFYVHVLYSHYEGKVKPTLKHMPSNFTLRYAMNQKMPAFLSQASRQELEVRLQWAEEQLKDKGSESKELEKQLQHAQTETKRLNDSLLQSRERRRAPAGELQCMQP